MAPFKDITLGQPLTHTWGARSASSEQPASVTGTLTYKLYIDGDWANPIAQANIDGVTLTLAPDSNPALGVGLVIDTSSNVHGNWQRGRHYILVVSGAVVDGVTVADVHVEFGIEYLHEPGRLIVGHTAQATAAGSITLQAGDVPDGPNVLAGCIVRELESGQETEILTSDDATDVCTISPEWRVVPSSTARYNIYNGYRGLTAPEIGVEANAAVEGGQVGTDAAAVAAKLPSKTYLAGTANSDGDIELDEATGVAAANVTQVNAVPLTGDGSGTPFQPA